MRRPRILIITRNLPPLVGGMEKLNWHMADELSKRADVTIIGPRDSGAAKPEQVTLKGVPLQPLALFIFFSFLKGLWTSLTWKPDIVFAGSGLTAPLAWLIGKLSRAKSAAYLHGFDITVNNYTYRRLWRPTFRRLDTIIVNSSPTKTLALEAGVPGDKIATVHPGVTLPSNPVPAEEIANFRSQNNLDGKEILLSVGRLTTRKGLREFVKHALPAIVDARPNAVLLVIGEAPQNSLGAKIQTIDSIKAVAREHGVENHIQFHGVITDPAKLSAAYEAADIHVFPVRSITDDPEGFGMVAIEAAAHNLPTVAFSTGGVVDAVKEGISGFLISPGNYQQFSKTVVQLLESPLPNDATYQFASRFGWQNFGTDVFNTIASALDETRVERKAHASTDLASRIPKAQKIEKLLGLDMHRDDRTLKLLEIGCGSGGIAHYFARSASRHFDVTGIDIHDNRQITEGYTFIKTAGVELPFEDKSFDIIITNHVIEHVGERNDQIKHLKEIARVLSPEGVGYLAVPNRWMITEPHYKLRFLSWLPRRLRTPYLRYSGKGRVYDCEPLNLKDATTMVSEAELQYENISLEAARVTYAIEKPGTLAYKVLTSLPDTLLLPLRALIPTLIFKIRKTHTQHHEEEAQK